ncbi:MAG: ABC transporter permease subunit [Gemmatimonadales bacterium]|nr:ABC transporter permease subunit [Gemmatimonadales bacterium]
MTSFRRVLSSQLRNVIRSRWMVGHALLLLAVTILLLRFGGSGERALLSLVNLVLLLVPLVSVVFGTLYVYNAREFIELLLAQPVGRGSVYLGLFGGLALPQTVALWIGVGGPLVLQVVAEPAVVRPLVMLLAVGTCLTLVFTAFALCVAVLVEERARGFGAALLVWLGCTVVYDGLILLLLTTFRDYPLESPVLILTFLNPVDLARVVLLLTFDVALLMGYTGSVFADLFGGGLGVAIAFGTLLVCAAIPLAAGFRWFGRKDF